MMKLFGNTFENVTVLLTGHTGFKGSWLSLWLREMGAKVIGFSLEEPPSIPSNFELSELSSQVVDVRGDIRNLHSLLDVVEIHRPALIIHFAAQTTVLPSYRDPKISFDTNVGGTINILETARKTDSVRAMVVCTTDKVYENKEWIWGYRENDELGGYDPYSSGKAMAEFAVTSYRRSFFSVDSGVSKGMPAVATVRAGNVIGGGDFTENGLLADSMRSIIGNEDIHLRNPSSTRPWQYVLEPLSGYLCLGERLLNGGHEYAQAWNFGPLQTTAISAQQVVQRLVQLWGPGASSQILSNQNESPDKLHEARNLHLNWDKAAALLRWHPVYDIEKALSETVKWYRAYQRGENMYQVGVECIERYVQRASELQLGWTC
jgi:CDP-glucose 4,6-dehydratase